MSPHQGHLWEELYSFPLHRAVPGKAELCKPSLGIPWWGFATRGTGEKPLEKFSLSKRPSQSRPLSFSPENPSRHG